MTQCNQLIRPNCFNEAKLIIDWTVSNGMDQSTGPIYMECGDLFWNKPLTGMKHMACHDTVRIKPVTQEVSP